MTGHDFARRRARIMHRGRSASWARRALAHLAREAGAVPVRSAGGKLQGHTLPDGFTVCELRRYPTERAAIEELANIYAFAHLRPRHVPTRHFFCERCRGYHLAAR